MKASSITAAAAGLLVGTMCPAPFTDKNVRPLSLYTFPAI